MLRNEEPGARPVTEREGSSDLTAELTALVKEGLAAVAEWEAENGAFSEEELAAARQRVAELG